MQPARPLRLAADLFQRTLLRRSRFQRRNLRAEMLTTADLAEQLREQGIEDFSEVRRCYLEGDGHLSVIRSSTDEKPPPPKRRPVV